MSENTEIVSSNADRPSSSSDVGVKLHAPRGRLKADPTAASDPMAAPRTAQRCSAHSKQTHQPCKQPAIRGGTVCRYHGGAAPQTMAKAEERLRALIHPAISRLSELIQQKEFPSVAIAAVKDALDRNGNLGKAAESVAVEHSGGVSFTWLTNEP